MILLNGSPGHPPRKTNANRLLPLTALRRGHYMGGMETLTEHRCAAAPRPRLASGGASWTLVPSSRAGGITSYELLGSSTSASLT